MVRQRKFSEFDDDAEEEVIIELRPDNLPEIFVPIPPNGGYGWVIVFAAFMISLITDGLLSGFGVLIMPLQEHFQSNLSVISFVGSVVIGFFNASGIIAAGLVNKYGCRSVVYMGTFLSTIALLLSSMSPNVGFMIFAYGFLGGVGMGMIYLPGIVAVSFYFDTKRSVATGISMAGSGTGSILAPIALKFLLDIYHWSEAFVIIAGIVLNCAVFGSLLRPLKPQLDLGIAAKRETMLSKFIRKIKDLKQCGFTGSGDSEKPSSEYGSQVFTMSLQNLNMENISENKLREYVQRFVKERNSIDMTMGNLNTIPEDREEDNAPPPSASELLMRMSREEKEKETTHVGSVFELHTKRNAEQVETCDRLIRSLGVLNQDSILNQNIPVQINTQQKEVALKDFSRPMYRKDIFFSGSIMDLDDYTEPLKDNKPAQNPILSSIISLNQAPGMPPINENDTMWKSNLIMSMTRIPEGDEQTRSYHPTQESPTKKKKFRCIPKALLDILKLMMDFSLLTNKSFACVCIGNLFALFGYFIPAFFALEFASSHNISEDEATYLLSIMGIANTVARIIFGWLGSLPSVSSLWLASICLMLSGVACTFIAYCTDFFLISVSMAIYGVLVAPWLVLTTVILCELVGLDKLSNAYGLIALARGASVSVGAPLAGVLFDLFKSYKICFMTAGGCMVLSAAFHLFVLLPGIKSTVELKDRYAEMKIDEKA